MPKDTFITPADIELRRELIAAGLTDRDIARLVARGDLSKVRYGAYVRTPLVAGMEAVDLMRVRSRAVLRTAHPRSVLSHQSALAEWGVPVWGLSLDETHVTRTDGKAGRREAGVAHHRAKLEEDEWTTVHGVPLVIPARAVIELVLDATPEVGLVAACGALSAGLATPEALKVSAAKAERWPNSLNARIVLSRADKKLTSVAEARTWHLFYEQRIARPEPQVEVFDEWGTLLGIVDFLWRRAGVFLEFDGRIKYEIYRRPGESLEAYLMREKRREEQICQVTGWVCIRITWADLENPLRTARRIRALLESRTTPAA